ncbi:MAG: UbiH/UbiF/VisC/COQ6 family ubiquinone biosynthesis hydroxylase [Gammaproteobacteria bacterium]|nr:UbiH/UbiF/VisC/COQ6 family ubiquinone biosynthesis hydroxylase [Gammaproteobacteria bacterium]
MNSTHQVYDIAIVGGGMVGSTLATCLVDSGLKIALLEAVRPSEYSPEQPPDLRVSALSMASRYILESTQTWAKVTSKRYCPFKTMRVWEGAGNTEFRANEIGRDELGYIVENRLLQLALLERVEELPGIDLICPAVTKRILYNGKTSTIELDNGSIQARLIIGADGANSQARQAARIGVSSWDYKQHAMVINVETVYGQQDVTWQRFRPSGPQAFLPLNGSYASLVWYNTPDEVSRLKTLDDTALLNELSLAFPACLGKIKQILQRGSFPLKRQHALDYVKPGVALIGDSAHTINPLAGQGVNIGLLDAAALAEVILDAARNGQDFAALPVLKRYEKQRKMDNLMMMTTMDAFYRVFSNNFRPVRLLRNLGLGLANKSGPAKHKIIRYAMGLEGNLPRLARGDNKQFSQSQAS